MRHHRLAPPAAEERAHEHADEAARHAAGQGNDQDTAAEVSADMAQREEAEREDPGLERRREHGANRPGNDADEDVINAQQHAILIRDGHDALRSPLADVGRILAAALRPGDVVALHGGLGAGKTTLVRAIVAALHGSDSAVSSPTFIFRQRYDGTPPVEHLDLYRLDAPEELRELGLEDVFDGTAVVLVEWPERAPGWLPAHTIPIAIDGVGDEVRTVTVGRPAAFTPG